MKVVAAIPIRGRIPLMLRTLRRLTEMGVLPVCACSTQDEERQVIELGGIAKTVPRMELGRKWNIIYDLARTLKPDAVLHSGSDDWFTENWIEILSGWLQDYEIVGVTDYYFTHFDYKISRRWDGYDVSGAKCNISTVYWEGYELEKNPHRINEPVGGGRLIRSDLLDMIDWKPFDNHSLKNLDYEMITKCKNMGCYTKTIKDDELKALSISTNLWPCKNGFEKMKTQGEPIGIEFLDKHFPEVFKIW